MEYVIHTLHRILHRTHVANVTDVEFHLPGQIRMLRLQLVTHIVLFFFIA